MGRNTVEKGEIAHYEQFFLFPQCFQKTSIADTLNQGLFGKGLTNEMCMFCHCRYQNVEEKERQRKFANISKVRHFLCYSLPKGREHIVLVLSVPPSSVCTNSRSALFGA